MGTNTGVRSFHTIPSQTLVDDYQVFIYPPFFTPPQHTFASRASLAFIAIYSKYFFIAFIFYFFISITMASPSDPKPSKKRVGRKRLPPLAPGPSIQFVVANHPDEFKAGETMRNVRSHVMYKHRELRGSSPSEKGKSRDGSRTPRKTTRTPSPRSTNSDGILEENTFLAPTPIRHHSTIFDGEFYRYNTQSPSTDPMRLLTARIISATTAAPARSAPPSFEGSSEYPFPANVVLGHESLEDLKNEYMNSTNFFCHGKFPFFVKQQAADGYNRPSVDATYLQQSPVISQPCQR